MSDELERGSVVGSYELLTRIGRGGMASVWVARGRPTAGQPPQLIAVKAMLPELAGNMEFRSMFLDEGQIVSSIAHPNVVRVYEVGETRGVLYMAMEWVEGDSLHTLIAEANKRRPIPPEVAVRLIADTAGGLHAAHEIRGWDGQLKEIVHCDVSPHNILIGLAGVVKLVDFGVAGAMNQISADADAKIRGKFGYMSPEQAQAKPLDRRSDVFSLGIVLFELTTGYRLFRGRDDRHTLELVSWGKIPRPTQVLASYPEQLEAIVMKALERDVTRRYQTALEFKEALEAYLVESRILVPAAGVQGIVRKVLGGKIEQRRQQIRAALAALDGGAADATLVSSESLGGETDARSVSVSGPVPPSDPSASSEPSSGDLGAAFLPGDGSSGVQTLSQPGAPPPSANRYLVVGAALGVLLAGGVAALLSLRDRAPTVRELPPEARASAGAQRPGASGARGPAAPTGPGAARGLSLEALPPEGALAVPGAAPGAAPAANPISPAAAPGAQPLPPTEAQLQADMEALRAAPAAAERLVLAEDAPGSRVAEIANAVTLDRASPAPGPAPAPRSAATTDGIDRAAAAAELTRAANLVGMCRRPGGDTGPGKALVVVGPSGRVESVSIEGKLSGGPVGECVARNFRTVKVPPFVGGSVTLSKSFVVPE